MWLTTVQSKLTVHPDALGLKAGYSWPTVGLKTAAGGRWEFKPEQKKELLSSWPDLILALLWWWWEWWGAQVKHIHVQVPAVSMTTTAELSGSALVHAHTVWRQVKVNFRKDTPGRIINDQQSFPAPNYSVKMRPPFSGRYLLSQNWNYGATKLLRDYKPPLFNP